MNFKKWEEEWDRGLDERMGDDGYATFSPDQSEDVEWLNHMIDTSMAESRSKLDKFAEKYGDMNIAEYLLHPERFNFNKEEQEIMDNLLRGGF